MDGHRMHVRIDDGQVKLLIRTSLDCSHRYRRTIEAAQFPKVKSAMGWRTLRPELRWRAGSSCLQIAMDEGRTICLGSFRVNECAGAYRTLFGVTTTSQRAHWQTKAGVRARVEPAAMGFLWACTTVRLGRGF